jgi:hypothetical protein
MIPRSLYAVDRQTPQLYERKAGLNEARNELNLGIVTSTRRIEPIPASLRPQ